MTIKDFNLDYNLKTSEERVDYVAQLLNNITEPISNSTVEQLSDYILFVREKANQKTKKYILSDNRCATIYKRETSYETLVSKLECGEDGLYNLIVTDKNLPLSPKRSISQEDIDANPALKELRQSIEDVEKRFQKAQGKSKYLLKKQLIEMHQDQYVIKYSQIQCARSSRMVRSIINYDLSETITIDENGEPVSSGIISFFNPKHIFAILSNYFALKHESRGKFSQDIFYMMIDFDRLMESAFTQNPYLYNLMKYKIQGLTNLQIQDRLFKEFNILHTVEYISSLWHNKIPKTLAEKAKEQYILWYYKNKDYNPDNWKKCQRCGQLKLRTNRFFSKNSTSKDGFYSICKECRNSKTKKNKKGVVK